MNNINKLPQENNFFSEVQTIIINRWLDALPSIAQPIDLYNEYDIDLLRDANFVAQLCLNQVQNKLPQWAAFNGNEYVEARKGYSHSINTESIHSLHLCEINWATSGPGFDWPEKYYLHYVDGYNILILTISQDSPDAYGYADLAISAVPAPYLENITEAAKDLLSRWWSAGLSIDHSPWQSLYSEGLISKAEALQLRDEVWEKEDEELDEEIDDE